MSAAGDIIVNVLDTCAFALAGAEVFGKEKLRKSLERLCAWAERVLKHEEDSVKDFYGSYLVKMVFAIVVVTALLHLVGIYNSNVRAAKIAAFYLFMVPYLMVLLVVGLVVLGRGYAHLLSLYDQPRALLKLGAALFLSARLMSISHAWEELPSAAEMMHLDAPAIRLGPGFRLREQDTEMMRLDAPAIRLGPGVQPQGHDQASPGPE